MKVQEVEEKVQHIREEALRGDHESAHGAEDELYREVLEYVAAGHNQFHTAKLAKAALKTRGLAIKRWCA